MNSIWTKAFWKAVVERILSTGAFALVGFLSIDGFDLRTADWGDIGQAVAVAAVLSLLKGLIANQLTGTGPSAVNAEFTASTTQTQLAPGVGRELRDADGDGRDDETQRFVKRGS